MNKLMMAASAAAFMVVSSFPAFAAEVTGSITAVDAASHSVTLDDGNSYVLPADFDVAALTVGLAVSFTYEDVDGTRTVSAVASPG